MADVVARCLVDDQDSSLLKLLLPPGGRCVSVSFLFLWVTV